MALLQIHVSIEVEVKSAFKAMVCKNRIYNSFLTSSELGIFRCLMNVTVLTMDLTWKQT
jgi:hypothetical protein